MAEKAPKLEIFGDSPTTEDGLGFDDYANILLELIGNFDVRSLLTIGIHGRWGSGKTSLMKILEARFEDNEGLRRSGSMHGLMGMNRSDLRCCNRY